MAAPIIGRWLKANTLTDVIFKTRADLDHIYPALVHHSVKHWLNDNSLKLYDKGNVLRSEVTINNPKDFRVWRTSELNPKGDKQWRILRRTVADVPRRAEICRAATHRHLEVLSVVHHTTPLAQEAGKVCRAKRKQGYRYRALRPLGDDAPLLEAVNRLEYAIAGFQNLPSAMSH